ncbi:MAG: M56 family metallopeptidase [Planctomycetaceae bacterium]
MTAEILLILESINPAAGSLTSAPFVPARFIAWLLIQFVWQGAATAGLLWLLLRAAGRNANLRYMLACLAMLVMAAFPIITGISALPATAELVSQSAANETGAVSTADDTVGTIGAVRVVTDQGFRWTSAPMRSSAASIVASGSAPGRAGQVRVLADRFAVPLSAAWLIGVILCSLRLTFGLWRVRCIRRSASEVQSTALRQQFAQVCQSLKLRRSVGFMQTDCVVVPTVAGWLRPIVLLPLTAASGLTTAQIQALLAHELAHVKRSDYLVNLLQSVVEIVLFYHPAVWWVSRVIREEREHCCDDIAVQVVGNREHYARTLLHLAQSAKPPATVAVAATGGRLPDRIRRVLVMESPDIQRLRAGTILPTAIAAMCGAAVLAPAIVSGNPSRLDDAVVIHHSGQVSEPDNAEAALRMKQIGQMPTVQDRIAALLGIARDPKTINPKPYLREAVRLLDFSEANEFSERSMPFVSRTPQFLKDQSYFETATVAAYRDQIGFARQIAERIESPYYRAWSLTETAAAFHRCEDTETARELLTAADAAVALIPDLPPSDAEKMYAGKVTDRLTVAEFVATGWAKIDDIAAAEKAAKAVGVNFEGAGPGCWSAIGEVLAKSASDAEFASFLARGTPELPPERAGDILVEVWKARTYAKIDGGRFDEAGEILEREELWIEDAVRVCLVRAMCRKGLAARADLVAGNIATPAHRAMAKLFVARLYHDFGNRDRADAILNECREFIESEAKTDDYVPLGEVLILTAETQALSGDTDAAMRTAEQIRGGAYFTPFIQIGSASDLYDLPFQLVAMKETAWLLISRAGLMNGDVEDAIRTARRIVPRDNSDGNVASDGANTFLIDPIRSHAFRMIAQHLVKAGQRERVEQLITEESTESAKTAMRNVLITAAFAQQRDDVPPRAEPQNDRNSNSSIAADASEDAARDASHDVPNPVPTPDVTFVTTRHVILHDGKIVDWDSVARILRQAAELGKIHPVFYSTNGGLPREEELREHRWKLYRELYDAGKIDGMTVGSISPRAGERLDRIQKPEDLVPDESQRMEGTVTTTNRAPAAGVEVFLLPEEHINGVYLKDGRLRNPLEEHMTQTDSDGRFVIYPEDAEKLIVACHPGGFAIATLDEFRKSGNRIQLRWWARVSGDRPIEGDDAKQDVNFTCNPVKGISFAVYETSIRDDGSFDQKYIPPGTIAIQRSIDTGDGIRIGLPVATIELAPRESYTVSLGTIPDADRQRLDNLR